MTRDPKDEKDKRPHRKVRCFISQQIVEEAETVELVLHGVRVRVHRRYVPCPSDPAPIP